MITALTAAQRNDRALGWEQAHLSSAAAVAPFINTLAWAMQQRCYPDEDVFGLRLAVEEALVNSIKHGHRCDTSKSVAVRYCIQAEWVLVEVRDQGAGFDPAAVPDPTAPENWERPSGRGLLLMRTYTSWLRFNRRGNCVRLCKYRTPLSPQD